MVKSINPTLTEDHVEISRQRETFVKRIEACGYTHYLRERTTQRYDGGTFTFYDIVRFTKTARDYVGRVTDRTTDARLDSLFYRVYYPEHLKPFGFTGTVRFSGDQDPPTEIIEHALKGGDLGEYSITKTPYISVPPAIVDMFDCHVDDEIRITVENSDGFTYSEKYHFSMMGDRLIIPLTKFKRLII